MAVPEVKLKQQVKALCSLAALSPKSGTPFGCYPCTVPSSHSASLPFDRSFLQSDLLLTQIRSKLSGAEVAPGSAGLLG